MLENILILLFGLIWGAGLGISWTLYQFKKCNDDSKITKVVIDVDELLKQAKEDK